MKARWIVLTLAAFWTLVSAVVVAVGYIIVAFTPLHVLLEDNRFNDGWRAAV